MIDPSGMSQYEERKESVFGPGFRPWIKSKRRLRAVQELGTENETPIIIPKSKYMLKQTWVDMMYEDIDPKDSSSPRYVNEDLVIMTALKDGDFHPLRDMLDGSHPNYPDGLDPNYRFPPKDRTLLQLASYYGDPDKVRILLAHGADVNALDSNGDNALYLALNTPERYHSFKILKMLRANGTNINHQNKKGWTVLHRACVLGDIRLTELVLSFKPDVFRLTDKNMACFQLVSRNLDEIWELFQENVTKKNKKRHQRMWAHIMSKDFVSDLFKAVEPSCSICKRKIRDCGYTKTTNYRLWLYKHKINAKHKKKM